MQPKFSIFRKMLILLVIMLIPVNFSYFYFNHVAERNLRIEVHNSSQERLSYFMSQLEAQFEGMMLIAGQMSNDPSLQELLSNEFGGDAFDYYKTERSIQANVVMLSSSSKWLNTLTVHIPMRNNVYSSDSSVAYQEEYLRSLVSRTWQYDPKQYDHGRSGSFIYTLVTPLSARMDPLKANYVVEMRVPVYNVLSMLKDYRLANQGYPFLYYPESELLIHDPSNTPFRADMVVQHIELHGTSSSVEINAENKAFIVNAIYSDRLKGYLIDYTPIDKVMEPVAGVRNVFYLSIITLLMMSLLASLIFYRHVEVPIKLLMRAVQRVRIGDYSVRVAKRGSSEFHYLFDRFNEMTNEIQTLIEKVYKEQLRSREATLKQLQSQINPHFLYNCLFFIKNMSNLGNDVAVERMTTSLGEFYRYATRTENRLATLQEELDFVQHYLVIQQLRMPRLSIEIDIPGYMMDGQLPRILLQPIVENAVVHGIERISGQGIIRIRGYYEGNYSVLEIEDNGEGMQQTEMNALQHKLSLPLSEDTGYGLWNVQQRLMIEFGEDCGLSLYPSELGGLRMCVRWRAKEGS